MKKPVYTVQGKNTIEIFADYHAEIIIITKEKQELRAIIDAEDVDKVKDYSWCKSSDGSVYNAATRIHLRRLLLDNPEEKVTHKDGNKMNCRKSNLEFKTNQGDNEYLIFEDHAEIIVPGTDGNEHHALIDLEDIDKCKGYYWRFHESVGIRCKKTLLHRLLTNCEGKEVIHKNGNKLDNRKENLIVLTHSEKTSFCKNKEAFLAEREQQKNKSYVSAPVVETNSLQCTGVVKVVNGFLVILDNGQQAIITEKDFNNAITKIVGNLE
jgi:hypothetical protein